MFSGIRSNGFLKKVQRNSDIMLNDVAEYVAATVLSVVAVGELFIRLPLVEEIRKLKSTIGKSFKVVSSSRISDHWKEKATQRYSRTILTSTCLLSIYLLMLPVTFCIIYGLSSLLVFESMEVAIAQLLQIKVQFIVVVLSIVYVFLRKSLLND